MKGLGVLKTGVKTSTRWRQPDDVSKSRMARYVERDMHRNRGGDQAGWSQAAWSQGQRWTQMQWVEELGEKRLCFWREWESPSPDA